MYRGSLQRTAARLFLAILILARAHFAFAQPLTDPHFVEFKPSLDDTAVSPTGIPLVQEYLLSVYVAGQSTAFKTITLGKPTPGSDGTIRVDLLSTMAPYLSAGVTYEARVVTSGPGGATPSLVSNQFLFTVSCSAPTLAPSVIPASAAGGSASVTVTATTGCAWGAAGDVPWLTVVSGASGSGSGTVGFTIAGNTSQSPRTGTLTIAGQAVTVTQAGMSCGYTLSSTSQALSAAGGSGSVTVTAPSGCAWTASSSAAWATVTAGASGTGPGTVTFSAAANTATTSRTATLTIGAQTFTITQAAVTCTYTLSATSQAVAAAGGSGSLTVTAPTGCAWTASSGAAWLTVTAGASGNGAGTVTFSATANTGASARTATLTIAGQAVTVTQAAASCSYTISPTSQVVANTGASGSISVSSSLGCAWTATSNASWITITQGASGSGDGAIGFTASANTGSTARTGALTIGGQTFTVTQGGTTCSYSVSPLTVSMGSAGGTATVSVTAGTGCSWSSGSSVTWLTLLAGSGTGNGSVTFSSSANASSGPRTGSILVAGRTVSVTQTGTTACAIALSPTSRSTNAYATTGSISVTTGPGCTWTATSSVAWIIITSAVPSQGTVVYSVTANTTGTTRTGTIEIGGSTFTVTQRADTKPSAPVGVRVGRGRQ